MELERCTNCQRDIPSVNFVMHFAHCQRNVEICEECGEPVSKANWQDHQEQYHRPVKCELYGKDVPKARLGTHVEDSCLERTVACIYCGLNIRFTELNDHEVYCGARTEPCDRCRRYVVIKDFENHVCDGSCLQSRSPTIEDITETLPCEFCSMQVAVDELTNHQFFCPAASGPATDGDGVEIIDDDDYSSHQRGRKRSHEEEIIEESPPFEFEEVTDGCHGEASKQDDSVVYALPCEVCGDLCPSDKLLKHQEECLSGTADQHFTDDDGCDDDGDDDDDDDDGLWFNNLNLDDRPRFSPRLDAFDILANFQPFFHGLAFHQRPNQRYF